MSKVFGLVILDLDRVCIGYVLEGGSGGAGRGGGEGGIEDEVEDVGDRGKE